uniref:3'-5' exonuclease domain-containing protein n=1 Tax=Oryza glumipatula TaxID=40148 RepID=A0A0D9YPU7_9ORYZ
MQAPLTARPHEPRRAIAPAVWDPTAAVVWPRRVGPYPGMETVHRDHLARPAPLSRRPRRHQSTTVTQNPVALLQLWVDRRCLIFPFLHADYIPGSLRRFLAGATDCFVGVSVDKDAERLSDDHSLPTGNTADLRTLAAQRLGCPELIQAGLQAVVHVIMGADLVKLQRVTMSRWDAFCLSNE